MHKYRVCQLIHSGAILSIQYTYCLSRESLANDLCVYIDKEILDGGLIIFAGGQMGKLPGDTYYI